MEEKISRRFPLSSLYRTYYRDLLLLTEDEEPCFERDYRKSKIVIFGWIYLHSSRKRREGQRERVAGKTGSC